MRPKLEKGILSYEYMTGCNELTKRYCINSHWHGPFECDAADFNKFFAQVKKGGEVSKIFVLDHRGVWNWERHIGRWEYLGK